MSYVEPLVLIATVFVLVAVLIHMLIAILNDCDAAATKLYNGFPCRRERGVIYRIAFYKIVCKIIGHASVGFVIAYVSILALR